MSGKDPASAGFTLVELIVVIVIVGILAAVAVPKYFDLKKEAEEMKLRQAYRSILTVIHVSQGVSLIAGADLSSSKAVIIDYRGQQIAMKYGLPAGTDMVTLAGLGGYTVDANANRVLAYAGDNADNRNRVRYRRNNVTSLELTLNGRVVESFTR